MKLCGAVPSCCCPSNKKHGGECDGEEAVIEALEIALKAIENQIPKKPVKAEGDNLDYNCPSCGSFAGWVDALAWEKDNYCQSCGQKLDWSDVK